MGLNVQLQGVILHCALVIVPPADWWLNIRGFVVFVPECLCEVSSEAFGRLLGSLVGCLAFWLAFWLAISDVHGVNVMLEFVLLFCLFVLD